MPTSTRITLRVSPGSKQDTFVGPYLEGWKMRVVAASENGKANNSVVRLLEDALSLPSGRVKIVAGRSSRIKIVEIDGLSADAVRNALSNASSTSR